MATSQPHNSSRLRKALGSFATGVTIITTRDQAGSDIGLTVNSFNSVSLDPPLVLWSLARSAHSLPAFVHAGHFAVHVLAEDQESLSNRFAQRGLDGLPLLEGCASRFECRTMHRYEGGDHVILVGEVLCFSHEVRAPLESVSGRSIRNRAEENRSRCMNDSFQKRR